MIYHISSNSMNTIMNIWIITFHSFPCTKHPSAYKYLMFNITHAKNSLISTHRHVTLFLEDSYIQIKLRDLSYYSCWGISPHNHMYIWIHPSNMTKLIHMICFDQLFFKSQTRSYDRLSPPKNLHLYDSNILVEWGLSLSISWPI